MEIVSIILIFGLTAVALSPYMFMAMFISFFYKNLRNKILDISLLVWGLTSVVVGLWMIVTNDPAVLVIVTLGGWGIFWR